MPNWGDTDKSLAEIMARIKVSIPPYEGRDPNTADDWYCKTCSAKPSKDGSMELKNCSQCKIARYCSVKCQKEDLSKHEEECTGISDLTCTLNEKEAELRSCTGWSLHRSDTPSDSFETRAGEFFSQMYYCRARIDLAVSLSHLAHEYEVMPLLELVLSHRLELLRLIAGDDSKLRNYVPFDLLNVNRDADCYAFIQHWIQHADDDLMDVHNATVEGEWLYPKGKDVNRLNDVFEAEDREKYYSLAFLTAMALLKLRIIAQYESQIKQFGEFANTTSGEKLGTDPLEHIQRHLMTTSDGIELSPDIIAEQESHLDRYFRIMNKNNPTLLRAIINPGPLMSLPMPLSEEIQRGMPSEAYGIVRVCKRMFARIPGAQARIERVVGPKPKYSCKNSHGLKWWAFR